MKKILTLCLMSMLALSAWGCAKSVEVVDQEEPASTSGESKSAAVEAEAAPLEVKRVGFYQGENGFIGYALEIYNPNMGHYSNLVPINVVFKDAEGNIVGTDQGCFCSQLYPNGTTIISRVATGVAPNVATVEASAGGTSDNFGESTTQQAEVDKMIFVEGLNETTDSMGNTSVMGQIVNQSEYTLEAVSVSVAYLDDAGSILGGDVAYASGSIAPGQKSSFATTSVAGEPPAHASVVAYVNVSYLSEA